MGMRDVILLAMPFGVTELTRYSDNRGFIIQKYTYTHFFTKIFFDRYTKIFPILRNEIKRDNINDNRNGINRSESSVDSILKRSGTDTE